MATKIIHKKSSVASKVPLTGDLDVGEIAINLTDKKLFTKDGGGSIIELGLSASDFVPVVGGTMTGDLVFDSGTGISVDPTNVSAGSGFTISVDGTDRLIIDDDGQVGIGGTPSESLTLDNAASGHDAHTYIKFKNPSWPNGADMGLSSDGEMVYVTHYTKPHLFYVNGSQKFEINSAGDVEISQDAIVAGDVSATNVTATGNVAGANLAITNWNTAYGWGDHASAGYLTSVDLSTLPDLTTALAASDELVVIDGGVSKRKGINEINLSLFNNDLPSGNSSWSVVSTTTTAAAGDLILANTSGGSFILSLPATPSAGDSVAIADYDDWETNNLTVGRNGSTIEDLSEDLVCNIGNILLRFVFSGTTWQLFTETSAQSTSGVSLNIDGGSASSTYQDYQSINGGNASG